MSVSGSESSSFTSHKPLLRILSLGELSPIQAGDGPHSSHCATVEMIAASRRMRSGLSLISITAKLKRPRMYSDTSASIS